MRPAPPAVFATFGLTLFLAGCVDLLGSGGGGGDPNIESVAPESGETSVSVLDPVIVKFSRRVDPTTLPQAVSLWNGDRRVLADPLLGNRNMAVILRPVDPLDFGTEYRVVVSGAVKFQGGTGLSEESSWVFRTEGLLPPLLNQDSLMVHLVALAHDSMRGRGLRERG